MKIAIGSDHAGFSYKEEIKEFLESKAIEIKDFGPFSDKRCDYADFAHPVAKSVVNKESSFGIAICGSGNGINMALNKHQEIRSALCWNKELAALARQHNDANVLALPARFIDINTAKECVDIFLKEKFEGGRHLNRINKIAIK